MNLLIHIGLHKTATTWLQQSFFAVHPEVHLLNDYMNPWHDELTSYIIKSGEDFSSAECRGIFQKRIDKLPTSDKGAYVISSEELVGNPLSGGYNRGTIAKRLADTFPEAKIMITTRNQSDTLYSLHQQMIKMGYVGSMTQLLKEDLWTRPCFQKQFLDYLTLYNLYLGYYDKESIGLFTQEELKLNSEVFIKEIYSFLNIDSDKFKINTSPVAKGLSERKISAMRLTNFLRKTEYYYYPIYHIKSELVRKVLTKLISFYSFFKSPKKVYQKKYKDSIFSYFSESNKALFAKTRLGHLDEKIINKYYSN
jgi:hypothetical protein